MTLRPVSPRAPLPLGDRDARYTGAPDRDALEEGIDEQVDRIGALQRMLYADGGHAMLIVLQGRDASGKDGTIRKVFTGVDPQGIEVTSYGVPSEIEQRHDFLWRIHHRVPPRGIIGVFNRSHYEDVLVPRVHGDITKAVLERRFAQINDFERMLAANGVSILKFFLHISRAEQKKRLEKRLSDPEKNWKFRAGDLSDRAKWGAYSAAYRDAIRRCSTTWAPWYVVPADDKKVRTLLIARTIADALERLKLRWPKADPAMLETDID
ncbi:MAG TPA: PPK2 family polyphosphate kinase [Burkholderiales bacterium]|nr:PPK2 family polyphosphate kinase [Burkholderiales bacterium]